MDKLLFLALCVSLCAAGEYTCVCVVVCPVPLLHLCIALYQLLYTAYLCLFIFLNNGLWWGNPLSAFSPSSCTFLLSEIVQVNRVKYVVQTQLSQAGSELRLRSPRQKQAETREITALDLAGLDSLHVPAGRDGRHLKEEKKNTEEQWMIWKINENN